MKERKSLRKKWLINTVSIMLVVGVLCLVAVMAIYGFSCYRSLRSDLEDRAKSAQTFFEDVSVQSYEDFVESCCKYAQGFREKDAVVLQFADAEGNLIASSDRVKKQVGIATPEIREAISVRDVSTFTGKDPSSGEWIMAVSCPMIYSNGEVAGVLRFVAVSDVLNGQILEWGLCAVAILALVTTASVFAVAYCARSILDPVAQITEKAGKIAGGAYGIQIKIKNEDELGDLAETINEMSTKIAQNEKMQSEFISSLSHELRTPLTAINGWSETLLGDDSLNADTRRGVRIISREAKRLTEMVVELLDFTRIQDGRMTLNVTMTDIRSEFEDTVFMYSSRLEQDGLVLDYIENDDEIPEISCDPQRLRQVFLNILDNAAKHGGEGKRIEASVHDEDGWVVFRIRDFGPGIPEDEIPLVKHKFYKGSSKARGTGIGLAVCDEIVQLHSGELELSNAEGGGTLVTVKLPAAQ